MSALGAVARGRRAAERRFTEECTITEPATRAWSEAANDYVETAGATVYAGACQVKAENVQVREVDAGEREVGVVAWSVHLPITHAMYDTATVGRGQSVTVTTSTADAGLVGKSFTVLAGGTSGQVTTRRVPVAEVV